MRVSATKTAPRVEQNAYSYAKGIKLYGQNNDYPQKILEIVRSSGTGQVCVDIYVKFIEGGGFRDQVLANLIMNQRKERANSLLRKCAKDLRSFNGFALLVKYNGLAQPFAVYNVPFEHCRIEIDKDKQYTGRVAIHPDWTGIKGLKFDKEDIVFVNQFNPSTVIEEMLEAGSPLAYIGQLLYFTADGDFEYPICPFDPVVTDMLTEEAVSTVKHRNAKNNFLPSGVLVRKGIKPATTDSGAYDTEDPKNREQEASAAEIKSWQGDSNACKMLVVDVDADEEKPEFIKFEAANYDKQYEYTENTVQENIGRMSMIPPILRGVDVGAGFGADLMNNAYDFMNNITDNERRMLEVAFMDVMQQWPQQFADYTVEPLKYTTTVQITNTPAV